MCLLRYMFKSLGACGGSEVSGNHLRVYHIPGSEHYWDGSFCSTCSPGKRTTEITHCKDTQSLDGPGTGGEKVRELAGRRLVRSGIFIPGGLKDLSDNLCRYGN